MNGKRVTAMLLALLALALLLGGCSDAPAADNVTPAPYTAPKADPAPTDNQSSAQGAPQTENAAPAENTPQTGTAVQTGEAVQTGSASSTKAAAPAGEGAQTEKPAEGDEAPPIFVDGQTLPRYEVTVSDLGWSKARAACWDQGGYLAVISSREELDEIAALAEEKNLSYVWIGCHREDTTLVWETEETVDFYSWASGEPSQFDYYDGVREDFILLRREGDHWYYNDIRDDPAGVFPEFYSGVMGYVCE